MPRNFVIPINHSDASKWAIEWASKNVIRQDDHVTLVHVLEGNYASIRKPINSEHDGVKEASVFVSSLTQLLHDCHVEVIYLEGERQIELLQYISDTKPDLVIIGSRSLRGVKKFVLKSTSHYLADHSPVPVMILHSNDQ
ncbi:hypothetical protein EDD86DRAFT_225787 [Gorgonomyces haynaldii]|nr:hypothetical protein EDD86DRAFT_225787 [Gorgonomyces haynaldii]